MSKISFFFYIPLIKAEKQLKRQQKVHSFELVSICKHFFSNQAFLAVCSRWQHYVADSVTTRAASDLTLSKLIATCSNHRNYWYNFLKRGGGCSFKTKKPENQDNGEQIDE